MPATRAASFALLLIATSSLVLAACGGSDGTAPPASTSCGPVPQGTFTATVDGQPFSANFITSATIQNGTALGPNIVQVNGVECPNGAIAGRQILITIGRLTPVTAGTYQLSAASQQQPPGSGYSGIGQVVRAPNLWYANLSDAAGAGSGSITFTTVTATRLAGSFQLTAVANPSNAANARERVVVTNGVFDLTRP
jgi:hypothetical protein